MYVWDSDIQESQLARQREGMLYYSSRSNKLLMHAEHTMFFPRHIKELSLGDFFSILNLFIYFNLYNNIIINVFLGIN